MKTTKTPAVSEDVNARSADEKNAKTKTSTKKTWN
jgi:hypothetical protein